jgi:hypothetical protein
VLVTIGVRSNAAALIAGLTFVFPSALLQYYFSTVTVLPTILQVLFGLGAIGAAKFPDGTLAEQSRHLRRLILHLRPASSGEQQLIDGTSLSAGELGQVDGAPRVAEGVS